jgi:hypothetical protein
MSTPVNLSVISHGAFGAYPSGIDVYYGQEYQDALSVGGLGSVVFTGSGGDDLSISDSENYDGISRTFIVKIIHSDTIDKYSWSLDGISWTVPELIPGGATAFHLAFGLWVEFVAVGGHDEGDYWTITIFQNASLFTPVDFMGMNTLVHKDVILTNGAALLENPEFVDAITGFSSYGDESAGGGGTGPGNCVLLNSYLNNVFTPYGQSSFKQLAYHHNHPVLRAIRLNNIILVDSDTNLDIEAFNKEFYEYPFSCSDKSIETVLIPIGQEGVLEGDMIFLKYPLGNDVSGFANFDLNNETGLNSLERRSVGNDSVNTLYQAGAIGSVAGSIDTSEVIFNGNPKQIVLNKQEPITILNGSNGKYKLQSLKYGETVFPKRENMGWQENRKREGFQETHKTGSNSIDYQEYWKDDEHNRTREDTEALNSQGVKQNSGIHDADLIALSKWPLDTLVEEIGGYAIQKFDLSDGDFVNGDGVGGNVFTHFVPSSLHDGLITLDGIYINTNGEWDNTNYFSIDLGSSKYVYGISIYVKNTDNKDPQDVTFAVDYDGAGLGTIGGQVHTHEEQWFSLYAGKAGQVWTFNADQTIGVTDGRVSITEIKIWTVEIDRVTCFNESGIRGEYEPQRILSDATIVPDVPDHPYVDCPGLQYTMYGNKYDDMVELLNIYLLSIGEGALGTDEHERFQLYYNIPAQTDKRPWYDTYQDYWKNDLKQLGKEYSNLAEFRISDSVEFYTQQGINGKLQDLSYIYNESTGEWVTDSTYNTGFLTLYGSDEPSSDDGGELNKDFLSRYVYSDFLHNFVTVKKEQRGFSKMQGIEFILDTIKKPLPYMGFYPATRVYQLATLFNKSYGEVLGTLGTNITQPDSYLALQAILHTLMAPGVMLNAIKSGVAVNFPTYVGKGEYYLGREDGNHPYEVDKILQYCTWQTPIGLTDEHLYGTCSLFTPPNMLVPFEALLDVKGFMNIRNASVDIVTDEGVHYVAHPLLNQVLANTTTALSTTPDSLNVNGAIIPGQGTIQPYFEMGNHNFLAETIKFFLHDELTKYFISKPESEFKEMEYGTVYYMDVVLKNKNIAMTEGYQWGEDTVPTTWGTYETLMKKQRGSLYGYPLNSTAVQHSVNNIRDIRDPMYGLWTPPYFYGDSVVRISFAPHEFDSNLQPGQSRKFSLEEIMKGAKIRTVKKTNVGGHTSALTSGTTRLTRFYPTFDNDIEDHNGFFNTINWADYLVDGSYLMGVFSKTIAVEDYIRSNVLYSGMMKIDASVNLWNKKRVSKMAYNKMVQGANQIKLEESSNSDNDSWVISSKWETPILDFSGHGYDTYCTGPDRTPRTIGEIRRARGMWYDYGVLPDDGEGIYLEIKESFPERFYDKHLFGDLNDDITATVNPQLANLKIYSGQNDSMKHSVNGELFGSLVETCGFKVGEKRLGDIADKKIIHEGVVVIPFIEREGKVQLFKVDEEIYKKQLENKFSNGYAWELQNGIRMVDTSITKTYDAMKRFVIPPQFDYRKFENLKPFVMYIFDVPFELSKQDLVDIWQNVMPDSFKRVEKEKLEISHRSEEYEFFHAQELPDDIRFMIFKVKQKAEWNYYNATPSTNEDKKFKFEVLNEKGEYIDMEPQYSYNWPYDFLSIVELARLDVNLTFEGL